MFIPFADDKIGIRPKVSINPFGNLYLAGETYLFMKQDFVKGSANTVDFSYYIYNLRLSYQITDEWSVQAGKHQTQIGNSLTELILVPFPRYSERRKDDWVNKIDDEGFWGVSGSYKSEMVNVTLCYLPSYGRGDKDPELKNLNEHHAAQAILGFLFSNVDLRTQVYAEASKNPRPYWAASVSYSHPDLSELIAYLDATLINNKDYYLVKGIFTGTSYFHFLDRREGLQFLSPLLLGVSYKVVDELDLKMEFLYDQYALSGADARKSYRALRTYHEWFIAESLFPIQFAGFYRDNVMSRYYIMPSLMWQVADTASIYLGYKLNCNDRSSLIVSGISWSIISSLNLEMNFIYRVPTGSRSEFGSFVYDEMARVKLSYYFEEPFDGLEPEGGNAAEPAGDFER